MEQTLDDMLLGKLNGFLICGILFRDTGSETLVKQRKPD